MKKSIVFYDSWGELIKNLPDEVAGALIKLICQYSFEGKAEPSGNEITDAMFAMIKTRLDVDAEAYRETIKRRSEAGKKGMQKRWGNKDITENNNVITPHNSVIKDITKITVNDNDNVNVNDNTNKKREHFVPPSLEDVRGYCRERGNSVDPETFIDFYSAKGWKVGNQPMKDWKACVRTWEKRTQKVTEKGHFENERNYDFTEIERQFVKGAI